MGRPRKFRRINFLPRADYFKPRGIPMRALGEERLEKDELEAVRLCDLEEMGMVEAAEEMQLSKSTIHRLLQSAHKKIAGAIIHGRAIRIID